MICIGRLSCLLVVIPALGAKACQLSQQAAHLTASIEEIPAHQLHIAIRPQKAQLALCRIQQLSCCTYLPAKQDLLKLARSSCCTSCKRASVQKTSDCPHRIQTYDGRLLTGIKEEQHTLLATCCALQCMCRGAWGADPGAPSGAHHWRGSRCHAAHLCRWH